MEVMATSRAALAEENTFAELLAEVHTESGRSLLTLATESPVLLVFLRHFGCAFCRKAIGDVAELSPELKERLVQPVFVHLGTSEIAKAHFDFYKLPDVERIHDPEAKIYQHPAFGLGKKSVWLQLVTPAVWAGWFLRGNAFKHGIGKIQGDGSQMPGVFFLKEGEIARKFIYRQVSDQPPYLKLIGS